MKNKTISDNLLDIVFIKRDEILKRIELIAKNKNYREIMLIIDSKHTVNFSNNSLERIKIFRPNDLKSLFNFILSLPNYKSPRLQNIYLFDPFYLLIDSNNENENIYLSTKRFYAFLINFLQNNFSINLKIHLIHEPNESKNQIIHEISKFYNIDLIYSNFNNVLF